MCRMDSWVTHQQSLHKSHGSRITGSHPPGDIGCAVGAQFGRRLSVNPRESELPSKGQNLL